MNRKQIWFLFLFSLVFLDPFLLNVPIGPLHVTILRIVLFIFGVYLFSKHILLFQPIKIHFIKPAIIFFISWFLYGVISIFWATAKTEAIKELYYFGVFLLLLFSIIAILDRSSLLKWIAYSFIGIGIITIFLSILELAFNFHLPTSRYVIEADTYGALGLRVATAFFYNENDLSLFFVMIAPFYLMKWKNGKPFMKVISFVSLFSIFAIMYMNGSRIAILAFLLQIAIFIFIQYRKNMFSVLRFSLIFTPLFIGIILYYSMDIVNAVINVTGITEHGSTSTRMNLILNGLYSTFQSFMLGVGAGNFQFHVNSVMFDTNGIINPHNWWIEIITNYGMVIFAFYIAFLGFVFRKLWHIYHNRKDFSPLALSLFLSYIGFVVACIGPSRLFYFWPMWLMYGVTLAFINTVYYDKINVDGSNLQTDPKIT